METLREFVLHVQGTPGTPVSHIGRISLFTTTTL